jgi:hypothetical protein
MQEIQVAQHIPFASLHRQAASISALLYSSARDALIHIFVYVYEFLRVLAWKILLPASLTTRLHPLLSGSNGVTDLQ